MGILNLTPDSFSDGGRFDAEGPALSHAAAMIAEGADIIDVGGESTRPGAVPVPAAEEIRRIAAVVQALAAQSTVPISIDTYKAATARAALQAGARMVNDVWGLQREPAIAEVAAAFGVPVVIMHNRAEADPALDIVDDIRHFFDASLAIARRAGIPDRHIVLDPGIGFGKTRAQNLAALARLPEIKALGFAVLVGASRKSLVAASMDRPPRERLAETLAGHVLAAAGGADILRVHDVREHVDALRVVDAVKASRP
jgi:dihydropteroate synthase